MGQPRHPLPAQGRGGRHDAGPAASPPWDFGPAVLPLQPGGPVSPLPAPCSSGSGRPRARLSWHPCAAPEKGNLQGRPGPGDGPPRLAVCQPLAVGAPTPPCTARPLVLHCGVHGAVDPGLIDPLTPRNLGRALPSGSRSPGASQALVPSGDSPATLLPAASQEEL